MMSLAYDLDPEQSNISVSHLRRHFQQETAEYLAKYCADLRRESKNLGGSTQFTIGIEYRLALTKKQDAADIVLSSGSGSGEPTQVVEVAKDSSTTHPFRQKEVIIEINGQISSNIINGHDINSCINSVHNVKARREWFYQGKVKGSPGQYSQEFVDWVVGRWRQDREFFQKTRDKYRSNT